MHSYRLGLCLVLLFAHAMAGKNWLNAAAPLAAALVAGVGAFTASLASLTTRSSRVERAGLLSEQTRPLLRAALACASQTPRPHPTPRGPCLLAWAQSL